MKKSEFIKLDKTLKLSPSLVKLKESVNQRLQTIERDHSRYYPLFYRVYAGQLGKVAAIKAKCLDCSCWQQGAITNCTVQTCPLWSIRPYQKGEEEIIKELTTK